MAEHSRPWREVDAYTLYVLRSAAGPHSDVQPAYLKYHIGELLTERGALVQLAEGAPAGAPSYADLVQAETDVRAELAALEAEVRLLLYLYDGPVGGTDIALRNYIGVRQCPRIAALLRESGEVRGG